MSPLPKAAPVAPVGIGVRVFLQRVDVRGVGEQAVCDCYGQHRVIGKRTARVEQVEIRPLRRQELVNGTNDVANDCAVHAQPPRCSPSTCSVEPSARRRLRCAPRDPASRAGARCWMSPAIPAAASSGTSWRVPRLRFESHGSPALRSGPGVDGRAVRRRSAAATGEAFPVDENVEVHRSSSFSASTAGT